MSDTTPTIALGIKDASKAIGMKETWLKHSDIPRVKLGRRTVWLVSDLVAYLEAHRSHGKAA